MTPVVDIYGGRDPRDIPNYTISTAAHLAGVSASTLRNWIRGRTYSSRQSGIKTFEPLIELPDPNVPILTFMNVVEAHVLASIRHFHGIPMQNIRPALEYVKKKLNEERPLTKQIFLTNGLDLFVHEMGEIVNASRSGQITIREFIEAYLARVEFDKEGLAEQLYPLYRLQSNISPKEIRDQPRIIRVNPRISFGKALVRGIPTASIASLFKAGDDIADIADDFELDKKMVEEALRYEYYLKAA
jgi:uncharacterized protein (DUF433 family)